MAVSFVFCALVQMRATTAVRDRFLLFGCRLEKGSGCAV
jgi:hypothetical protein